MTKGFTLENGKYDQAIVALETIMEIDPKKVKSGEKEKTSGNKGAIISLLAEAYYGYVEDEIKAGNYISAKDIAKEAQEKTNDPRFYDIQNKLYAKYGIPIIEDQAELFGYWQIDFRVTKEKNNNMSLFSLSEDYPLDNLMSFDDDGTYFYTLEMIIHKAE